MPTHCRWVRATHRIVLRVPVHFDLCALQLRRRHRDRLVLAGFNDGLERDEDEKTWAGIVMRVGGIA